MTETIRWSCTTGVNSGYELENQRQISEEDFAAIYQETAREVYEETGTYISAVINQARFVYHEDWGCPAGGEYGYMMTGSCNPAFSDKEAYLAALKLLIGRLKEKLGQKTMLLEIMPASVLYLTENEKQDD